MYIYGIIFIIKYFLTKLLTTFQINDISHLVFLKVKLIKEAILRMIPSCDADAINMMTLCYMYFD